MIHPILNSRKSATYYLLGWLLFAIIHFFILHITGKQDFAVSIVDSIIYNTIFCIIGFALWFVLRYSTTGNSKFWQVFITHIITGSIFISIWIYLGNYLTKEILLFFSKSAIPLRDSILYRSVSGLFYYTVLTFSYYLITYYANLSEKIANEAKLESMIKESKLNVIKSQINPHFLFNSLNSISSLTMHNPPKAQEMIINLSEYLRYSISHKDKQLISLNIEIDNCKKYLDIEKIRFGDRLDVEFIIKDNCLTYAIPSMILQPLYENAIKHGVYESTKPIKIATQIKCRTDMLEILIINNFDPDAIPRKGEGFGLKSIKDRLALIYNDPLLLQTKKYENSFEARLLIPQ